MQQPNEHYPELLSTAAFNLSVRNMSGSRLQMLGAHLTQMLVLHGATPRRCITGVEREFGNYTFKAMMPVDATVIAVIPKFHETIGPNAIASNPMSIVVYEDVETRQLSILEIPQYHMMHQYFGFRYKHKRAMSMLYKGAAIRKGTVFSDSPSIDDNGDYMYGVEANMVTLTLPGIIEDGIIISSSMAKKMTTTGFDVVDGSWGQKYYPLNLYGDDTVYKPFPDIGERVRPDGLVMAFRERDDLLDPVYMTPAALRRLDMLDKRIYSKANAKVVDIVTRFDPKGQTLNTPTGMDEQVRKYHTAQLSFYSQIIDVYEQRQRAALQRNEKLSISRHFHRLIREAQMFKLDSSKVKATRIVQRQPLDEWRVDITLEYNLEPTLAYKATDTAGGKGVVVQVWNDEDMPIDKHGRRADIIVDGNTTLNRMNPPRLFEQYLNGTSDQIVRELKQALANGPTDEAIDWCWNRVIRYYEIVSPIMHRTITSPSYRKTKREHIDAILSSPQGLRLMIPTYNEVEIDEMMLTLKKEFPIDIGPVTFRGKSGNVVTTHSDALIASFYVISLEKIGSDWSAVSSGTLQQHGVLTKQTRHDKNSRPGKASATRTLGEDEERLVAATTYNNTTARELIPKYGPTAADGLAVAELVDMSNNPTVHMEACRSILTAEKPTNIQRLIDRKKFPRGGSRSLVFIKHALQVAGLKLTYRDDIEDDAQIYQLDELGEESDVEVIDDEEED